MKKRIALTQVIPNPDQPRKTFDQQKLRELANSIEERGLIQAITVRPLDDGRYMITAGERRWRAHQLIKAKDILCEVVNIDEDEMALQAIVENLARVDVRPIEEARAFQSMLDRGWTVEKLAKDIGATAQRITSRVALLQLDESIQKLVDTEAFPLGHANYLVDIPRGDQLAIVKAFTSGKLKDWSGVRAAAQAVRDRVFQPAMFDAMPKPSPEDVEAMSRIERHVERIVAAIASGWKDGECVSIKTVDPNKADTLAETLAVARRTIANMESQLRAAHARAVLV